MEPYICQAYKDNNKTKDELILSQKNGRPYKNVSTRTDISVACGPFSTVKGESPWNIPAVFPLPEFPRPPSDL